MRTYLDALSCRHPIIKDVSALAHCVPHLVASSPYQVNPASRVAT